METINVNLTLNPYPVYVGNNILSEFGEVLKKHHPGKQIALITSRAIYEIYGKKLLAGFSDDQQVATFFVPDGESAKSIEQVNHLYTRFLENKFERNVLVVAFGGGVIGDLAGFVAATYLRGVPFVQVPTTLLAQVDSSIGGKTGINHPLGKNLIGAFKQPVFVFCDSALLSSLPDAEIRCGLGEVIKYGFILNKSLFEYLEQNIERALEKDEQVLLKLVKISAAEKVRVVEQDEREDNLRMILNFGHTFGHALEAEYKFGELKHGEAVILGMKCALNYERRANKITEAEFERSINLLDRIPVKFIVKGFNFDRLLERMSLDKKVKDKKIRVILVDRIGSYRVDYAENPDELKAAFQILMEGQQ